MGATIFLHGLNPKPVYILLDQHMKVKEDFFARGFFEIGNGNQTRFWEDVWLGDRPLATQYPSLYNVARRKNMTVAEAINPDHLNIEFRRNLVGGDGIGGFILLNG
jgi:hypothetical protein